MEKEYGSGEEGEEEEEVEEENDFSSELSDEAPELITSREDFEAMMDDFMDNYELLGRKLKPVLPGDSGPEKLDTLRRAMGQDERVRIKSADDDDDEELDDAHIFAAYHATEKEDRWDCETILSESIHVRQRNSQLTQSSDIFQSGEPSPRHLCSSIEASSENQT